MTAPAVDKPRWNTTRRLVIALLAVLLVSASGLPARAGGVMPFAVEVVLVVLGAALALRLAADALGQQQAPRVLRVAAVLLVVLGAGQLARSKKLFPAVPYTMYGRAEDGEARFYVYEAHHRTGARTRFGVSTVFASLGNARVIKGLARELDAMAKLAAAGEDASAPRARLRAVMSALIARHNREHPADPVVGVDAVLVTLPPPFHPGAAQRRVVMTFAAEPAP